MADIVDPFDAKPASAQIVDPFDKSAPPPAPAPQGWDVASKAAALARGTAAGFGGTLGDVMPYLFPGGTALKTAESLFPDVSKDMPTTENFLKYLPGQEAGQKHPYYQMGGEMAGSMAAAGPGASREAAVELNRALPLEEFVPGATKRAQQAVTAIAKPSDVSTIGEGMRMSLSRRLTRLWEDRRADTEAARAAFEAQNDKIGPVIKDYRDLLHDLDFSSAKLDGKLVNSNDLVPAQKRIIRQSAASLAGDPTITRVDTEIRRLNDIAEGPAEKYDATQKILAGQLARKLTELTSKEVPEYGIYREMYAQRSAPINLFTMTTQGKKVITEMADMLPPDTFKVDAASLPATFFRTRQSVRLLSDLSGGDKEFVEAAARAYAGTQLDAVTQSALRTAQTEGYIPFRVTAGKAAGAAERWYNTASGPSADPPRVWLKEIPGADKAVQEYIAKLERTAKTQKAGATAAGTGALLYLMSQGEHPWYWLRHHLGLF